MYVFLPQANTNYVCIKCKLTFLLVEKVKGFKKYHFIKIRNTTFIKQDDELLGHLENNPSWRRFLNDQNKIKKNIKKIIS